MSVRSDPTAGGNIVHSDVGTVVAQGGSDAQDGSAVCPPPTARQIELNRYYAYYRCSNYDARKIDWNGQRVPSHIEHDAISSQGFIPPGFVDQGGRSLPLKFRRPSAPYYIARVVVNRYTGLLFSEDRCPTIGVQGDAKRQAFLRSLAGATNLFEEMKRARALGGAMGSVAVGFEIHKGKPLFTVYDPRWCTAEFKSKDKRVLERLEIKYPYSETTVDPIHGPVTQWFWYRRVIDELSDRIWEKVPIVDGELEPEWGRHTDTLKTAAHHAGRVPAVWIQNEHVEGDVDGDPDCHGTFELMETYDMLQSQANRGILANCDPTRVISSDDDFGDDISFGSNAAVQVEKGGSVTYLELNGTGPKAAREQANDTRERIYEMVSYVPDDSKEAPQQTAFEVGTRFSRMLERADTFRTAYGRALRDLLEIAIIVCKAASTPRLDEDTGTMVQGTVTLPPRFDEKTGEWIEEEIGTGGAITLSWPPYFKPTLDEITKASTAVAALVTSKVITNKDGAEFMRKYMTSLRPADEIAADIESAETEVDAQAENGIRGKVRGGMGF